MRSSVARRHAPRRAGRAATLALALSCALAGMLLAGCGQKGPLVLPPAAASAPAGK